MFVCVCVLKYTHVHIYAYIAMRLAVRIEVVKERTEKDVMVKIQIFNPDKRLNTCESIFFKFTCTHKTMNIWSSHCGTVEMNRTITYEDAGSIPRLAQQNRDPVLP